MLQMNEAGWVDDWWIGWLFASSCMRAGGTVLSTYRSSWYVPMTRRKILVSMPSDAVLHTPPVPQSALVAQPPAGLLPAPVLLHGCSKTLDTMNAGATEPSRANASS